MTQSQDGYSVYTMLHLAINFGNIDKDEALDIQWEVAEHLYADFSESKYNDARYSEYDCIVNFLKAVNPLKLKVMKPSSELTKNQKEVIDSLIYKFGRMNESKGNKNDLLSYINNQLDEQSVLRAEFREKSNAFDKINQQILVDLKEQIKSLTDHFGYELKFYGDMTNGFGYVGITIYWRGHAGLYKNYETWYANKKWKWFGDTSINSFQGLTDYGFEYSRGTRGCNDYRVFLTEQDLLKDIANQIIEIRKRSL